MNVWRFVMDYAGHIHLIAGNLDIDWALETQSGVQNAVNLLKGSLRVA